MASNILFLPFRRSHSVNLTDAIKQYISSKYDQHPDMFTKDLETIEKLRSVAVHAQEPHPSNIPKLQQYAAQLIWLSGKFPIDIGVEFPWYPALGYNTSRPTSRNNLRFELANIMFNLAAMYSQLAMSSNRSTPDGLKAAANNFCLGAGVLSHLRNSILPELRTDPPEDMDIMTLECLEKLLLAQGQECFWQKAVKDGLKDATIAKLAARVSDLYNEAGDAGIQSDAISSEWIHHMTAKHHHFAAAAQYRAACDTLEKRKYGEEVARLRDSLTCVNEALKEQRYINKLVLADLNGLKNRITEDLKRAEKDNDMIYLLPVPPKAELKILDRANMVVARVPKEIAESNSMLGERGELGPALFSKLVPYSVHLAASIYVDRRDRLVNNTIVEQLEALTNKIHEVLRSLNLPGSLQALEKPLGLPPGLVAHADEIRQQDGINRLLRSMEDTKKLMYTDQAIYQEGVQILRSEAAEDEGARRKFGTERWTRPPAEQAAPKLYAQIQEIDGYFRAATNSDDIVKKKLKENEHFIQLLSGPDHDLENYVPSGRRPAITGDVEREAGKLRGSFNEVSRLESRRRRKIEALRTKAKQDDINPELLREAARLEREFPMQTIEAVQFESLFDKRLQMYDADQDMVHDEEKEQEAAIKRLQDANAAFLIARRGDQSTKKREQALQNLENAYFKYKEIISNLDVGRKFYNDLAKIVNRFRDEARTFAYNRKSEASHLENDLSTRMSSLGLQQATSDSLHQQKQADAQNPNYGATAHAEEPLAAPTPTRANMPPPAGMWTPEVGIRFSGVPTTSGNARPAAGPPQDGRWDPAQGLKFG
ncbi:pH-response regulator protein palA/RIM20 [Pyrenophora tritici-repentis]|uniref:PH-response regulator protein palA/RIM20 n=1 Tax=Pyrenophora tritici-repentis TaxID=45151 RepID=A0A2W1DFK4_9PLEO|nr:pH-response regulator protein palA/RIM20 [Pyrenophora tritici-repentis]KAI1510731.1 pH-response regulator protein palA/RIM20 [Pyrenophora tritici-repentis]KAI1681335.1 pH-response regulator protein palA/RIM20 [Pyrenophora tritici-repentis]PZC95540.1 BRO1 multi-domain protein [Pyrenophora tritici-repentis]